jgi:hypothetical protein
MANVNDFDIGGDAEENLVSISPNHSHSDLGIACFRRRIRVSADEFGCFPDEAQNVLRSDRIPKAPRLHGDGPSCCSIIVCA